VYFPAGCLGGRAPPQGTRWDRKQGTASNAANTGYHAQETYKIIYVYSENNLSIHSENNDGITRTNKQEHITLTKKKSRPYVLQTHRMHIPKRTILTVNYLGPYFLSLSLST